MVNYIESLDVQLDFFHDDSFLSLMEAEMHETKGVIWDGYEL